MDSHSKGQVGVEVLAIVSIVLVMLIPFLLSVYYNYASFNERLSVYQATEAVSTLATLADATTSSGPGSNVSTQITIPSGLKSVSFQGREIVFQLETSAGRVDIVRMVKADVEGDAGKLAVPGTRRVEVASVMEGIDDEPRVRISVK